MGDLALEREAVREAGRRAEYPPGSMAAGSLTETRNVARARVEKCLELGGWLRGVDGCARCGMERREHVSIHNPSDG